MTPLSLLLLAAALGVLLATLVWHRRATRRAREQERRAAAYRWELQQQADVRARRRTDRVWASHAGATRRRQWAP